MGRDTLSRRGGYSSPNIWQEADSGKLQVCWYTYPGRGTEKRREPADPDVQIKIWETAVCEFEGLNAARIPRKDRDDTYYQSLSRPRKTLSIFLFVFIILLPIHSPHIGGGHSMPRKTDKLNIRIDPVYKNALQKAAELEHRSLANMIEVMIRDLCARVGIRIPTLPATPSARPHLTTNRNRKD